MHNMIMYPTNAAQHYRPLIRMVVGNELQTTGFLAELNIREESSALYVDAEFVYAILSADIPRSSC